MSSPFQWLNLGGGGGVKRQNELSRSLKTGSCSLLAWFHSVYLTAKAVSSNSWITTIFLGGFFDLLCFGFSASLERLQASSKPA